jgi:hypothetical protein
VLRESTVKIVISYAREDLPTVQELVQTLSAFGHEPWTDAGAHSGGRWWDEIMTRIRECDVLLAVTSPASLTSGACMLERQYASALRKPFMPVMVAPIEMRSLPSEFAQIQILDYTRRDANAGSQLFRALSQLPPAPPLPRPLPMPPPAPLSYLNAIADRLQDLPPDPGIQHRIITDLAAGMRSADPEERAAASKLIRGLLSHPQILHESAQRAQSVLHEAEAAWGQPVPIPAPAGPPPKRSRLVTLLAGIGGVVVALILISIVVSMGHSGSGGTGSSSGSRTSPPAPQPAVVDGSVMATAVENDMLRHGLQPGDVACGSVAPVVGATTQCTSSELPGRTFTVRILQVEGNRPTGWDYPDL